MPFKSQSQKEKFDQLLKEKKISQDTYDRFAADTDFEKLPKHATNNPRSQIIGQRKPRRVIK